MKISIVFLFLVSFSAIAGSNCISEVNNTFTKNHPTKNVKSIRYFKTLKGDEGFAYRNLDGSNGSKYSVDMYIVESAVAGASFSHVALVEADSCSVEQLLEADFR